MKLKLLVSIFAVLLLTQKSNAQKVKSEDYRVEFTHKPKFDFSQKHKTYRLTVDMGDVYREIREKPSLKGLTINNENPDLIVKVYSKDIYVKNRSLKSSTVQNATTCYYEIIYGARWGFTITDAKTGTEIYIDKNEGGTTNTKSFNSEKDLNRYTNDALAGDISLQLIQAACEKITYFFNDNTFDVRCEISTIDDKTDQYREINNASGELTKMVQSKNFDKTILDTLSLVFKKYLQMANFEDKKAMINKKVAKALVNNICVAQLLTENYTEMKTALNLGNNRGKSVGGAIFDDKPSFRLYNSLYTGSYYSYNKTFKDVYLIIDFVDYCDYELWAIEKVSNIKIP